MIFVMGMGLITGDRVNGAALDESTGIAENGKDQR